MGFVGRCAKVVLRRVGIEVTRGDNAVLFRKMPKPRPQSEWVQKTGLRLNLGCGEKPLEGYVNVDIVPAPGVDLVGTVCSLPMLPDGCAVEVRMDAVFEHLYRWERPAALAEWRRLLAPGGQLCINWIPDFELVVAKWQEQAPGLVGPVFDLEHVYRFTHGLPTPLNSPHQLHKDIFTMDSVRAELEAAGLEVEAVRQDCFEDEPYPVGMNVVAVKPGSAG